jgi:GT2 family glycosyltransferase
MKLSVVIPTHNKRPLLARALAALAEQKLEGESWEVVVVDDGSSDGTARQLQECPLRQTGRLQVVAPGRNVGRAAARNLGWRAARGELILFLDDDIIAPPGLLAAHLALLRGRPGTSTIGCVRTDPALVDGPHFHYIDDRGVAKIQDGLVPARYFVTQNAAVARADLQAVGGFDERFRAYGLEDMEVAFRLEEERGVRFWALRSPVPLHVHHHTLSEYLEKKRVVGRSSLPLLARLHPHRLPEMRLHWVLGAGTTATDRRQGCRVRRCIGWLAAGSTAGRLQRLAAAWPVRAHHRPILPAVHARLLDALVIIAYRQGLQERAPGEQEGIGGGPGASTDHGIHALPGQGGDARED